MNSAGVSDSRLKHAYRKPVLAPYAYSRYTEPIAKYPRARRNQLKAIRPLDLQILTLLQANIFQAAWPAIGNWNQFPWHKGSNGQPDTWKPHSSQALAIDVFGTICTSDAKANILNTLARQAGLQESSTWSLFLEWLDPANIMREINQRTQVDALAMSDTGMIFFECKFTETDGGQCSQPSPIHHGPHQGLVQCNGNFETQTNPVNHKTARCALSAKGVRYWEIIPQVFRIELTEDHRPCPFAGTWYQWMRNITNAYAIAQATGRQAAFFLVYADAPNLPIAKMVRSAQWEAFSGFIRPNRVKLVAISFQDLLHKISETDPSGSWKELNTWVFRKIEKADAEINA